MPEGEEAPEPTEEEAEQGPEPLSTLDKDAEVEGAEAWTPLLSSTNSGVKNQVSTTLSAWHAPSAYSGSHQHHDGTQLCWGLNHEECSSSGAHTTMEKMLRCDVM